MDNVTVYGIAITRTASCDIIEACLTNVAFFVVSIVLINVVCKILELIIEETV